MHTSFSSGSPSTSPWVRFQRRPRGCFSAAPADEEGELEDVWKLLRPSVGRSWPGDTTAVSIMWGNNGHPFAWWSVFFVRLTIAGGPG